MKILVVIALVFVAAGETRTRYADQLSGELVVRLDTGSVRGYVHRAQYDAEYISFRGIPYAAQPVGIRRFVPPEPAETWSGTLDARHEGPICPQRDFFYRDLMKPRGMDEACLYVNVHVPRSKLLRPTAAAPPASADNNSEAEPARAVQYPVLVFIHGGGFGFGSGDSDLHGPEYLVNKGVIIVTFNYRLGALGFLTLNSAEMPGNLGMRDIVEVLRWVRRNIAAFGGNPDDVTIGGQSAGAAAAHLLTLSHMSKGLFQRAILMSGAPTRSWLSTSPTNGKRLAEMFLQKLNITSREPQSVFRALQEVPVDDIVEVTSEMQKMEGVTVFVPVVESRFDGVEPFLDEDPYKLVTEGRFADIPLVIGYTNKECYSFAQGFREVDFMKTLHLNPVALVPPSLIFESTPAQLAEHVAKIMNRYFSGPITEDSFEEFLDYCSDSYFVYPALKLAEMISRHANSSIYVYEFAYDGEYSPVKREISGMEFEGAGHVEDMTYLLKTNSYAIDIATDSLDEWVSDWMTAMFSNFIKTSDPTPEEVACDRSLEWKPYTGCTPFTLVFNATIAVQQHRRVHLLSFFDELHDTASSKTIDGPTENRLKVSETVQNEDCAETDTATTTNEHNDVATNEDRNGNTTQDNGVHDDIVLPSNDLLPPKTD